MQTNETEATVTLGDGVVTVRRKGSTRLTVANILGQAVADNKTAIYLDRLVHKPHESSLGTFHVHGATTSILVAAS